MCLAKASYIICWALCKIKKGEDPCSKIRKNPPNLCPFWLHCLYRSLSSLSLLPLSSLSLSLSPFLSLSVSISVSHPVLFFICDLKSHSLHHEDTPRQAQTFTRAQAPGGNTQGPGSQSLPPLCPLRAFSRVASVPAQGQGTGS